MRASPLSIPGIRGVLAQLGSKSFLEPTSLLVLVVPITALASVAVAEPSSAVSFLYWLLANFVAIVLVLLIILGLRRFWSTKGEGYVLPIWSTIAIASAISFIKTLLTLLAVSFLSGGQLVSNEITQRLIGGTAVGTAALLVTSASVVLLQEFQAERALLLTAKTMFAAPMVTSAESKKLAQLAAGIADVLERFKQGSKALPVMEAKILRELVDKYVRPLSSSLYAEIRQDYQSFTARELLRSTLRTSPPALALGVQYLFALPRNIEFLGASTGIIHTLLAAPLIAGAIYGLSLLARVAKVQNRFSYLLIATIAPLGVVWFLVELITPQEQLTPPIVLILALWYLQSAIVFGMAKVALTSAARNRREVSELVQLGDAAAALALLRRNRKLMANQMHGEVQSRLMNLVLASESGAALESQVVIAELEAIQQLIENVKQERQSLKDSLARLVNTWSGFAELDIDLRGAKIAKEKEDLVFALIEEGVSNAIRHGLADRVSVRLEPGQLLVISDNGMGPTSGKPGLGSKLFDAGSENWSLTALEDGGSRLEARLRLD